MVSCLCNWSPASLPPTVPSTPPITALKNCADTHPRLLLCGRKGRAERIHKLCPAPVPKGEEIFRTERGLVRFFYTVGLLTQICSALLMVCPLPTRSPHCPSRKRRTVATSEEFPSGYVSSEEKRDRAWRNGENLLTKSFKSEIPQIGKLLEWIQQHMERCLSGFHHERHDPSWLGCEEAAGTVTVHDPD
jgi:hypothetical protein